MDQLMKEKLNKHRIVKLLFYSNLNKYDVVKNKYNKYIEFFFILTIFSVKG